MAKQLYWSIKTEGSSGSPPVGLGCFLTPDSLVVAYVSDSADPGAVLLDDAHADVLGQSVVRSRRVATLVAKLVTAQYTSASQTWEALIEYDETALESAERELTHCDICQIECLTCDAQAKITGALSSGEEDAEWNAGYGEYLTANPELDGGGLDDLSGP